MKRLFGRRRLVRARVLQDACIMISLVVPSRPSRDRCLGRQRVKIGRFYLLAASLTPHAGHDEAMSAPLYCWKRDAAED